MRSEKDSKPTWEKLSEKEKTLMIMYKAKLQSDAPFASIKNLIVEANKIHEKHPDFSLADVP